MAHEADKGSPQLAWRPAAPDSRFPAYSLEHLPAVRRVQGGAELGREDQLFVVPVVPGRTALVSLALPPLAERRRRHLGKRQRAARTFGLRLAMRTHRSPHGHVRRKGRAGVRIAVKIHMLPAQRPDFLGADSDQQAQHDVGIHQAGRPADVLKSRMELDHRQALSGGDDRYGLLQGQGL